VNQSLQVDALMTPAPPARKPSVSVVIPAYNEEGVLVGSLDSVCAYMRTIEDQYDWEIVLVDDGSKDATPELADEYALREPHLKVLHHAVNFQIGQALRYAFANARGDYIVVLDCDLSYSPDHIGQLLIAIIDNRARIVIASPYLEGGQVSAVPWRRRVLSKYANKFLSMSAKGHLSTITGMVRCYDRRFLQALNLKAMDTEINIEIIYKAQLLRARIVEIPAHLDWSYASKPEAQGRISSIKVSRSTLSSIFQAFIFRPFMFFIVPGLLLLLLGIYSFGWFTWNVFQVYPGHGTALDTAIGITYRKTPQSFFVASSRSCSVRSSSALGFLLCKASGTSRSCSTWVHRSFDV
jgi:dolichol-phosphate mannosyltransferase